MCELIQYVQKGGIQQFQKGKTIIFLFPAFYCFWSDFGLLLAIFQSTSSLLRF